ncbi:11354_t:CDS:1 [Acaulospora colombiana]|uniref:11354_t:CDS:1 n=1 Tax=Acaulospora colombiana TaxID=27376 RepID=A0ACA9KST5_9GLOM|nr:11354_t:CDS:1 [Acaulospora colombiana]
MYSILHLKNPSSSDADLFKGINRKTRIELLEQVTFSKIENNVPNFSDDFDEQLEIPDHLKKAEDNLKKKHMQNYNSIMSRSNLRVAQNVHQFGIDELTNIDKKIFKM